MSLFALIDRVFFADAVIFAVLAIACFRKNLS